MVNKVLPIEFDSNGDGVINRTRQKYGKYSRQYRFNPKEDPEKYFLTTLNWVESAEIKERKYSPDSRKRDKWLREFIKLEPFLHGVISSVVDIDKNRSWSLTGGRNQVIKFRDIMHNFSAAPGYVGWRPAIGIASKTYWGSDIGSVIEVGRDGEDGPVAALYNTDPANCSLTGDDDKPLAYFPPKGKSKGGKILWGYDDFFRVSSMINDDERYNGLGYCAVSRCLDLAKLMIAVYEHDREQLGMRAPRGLLLLKGFTRAQWIKAMEARDTEMDASELEYYGALAVLASNAASIDAKLIALSNLPVSFNLREWIDMLIYGYALCFGFDAAEFIPVQFGALGRGEEQAIQHEKATGKGRLDFVLNFQEQWQSFLPDSVLFLFDQRDDKGDLLKAQVRSAQSKVALDLYNTGKGLLSFEESRILLADYGVIPRDWTEITSIKATAEEDEEKEDIETEEDLSEDPADKESEVPVPVAEALRPKHQTKLLSRLRQETLESGYVLRAAQKYPDEPIVQYIYPGNFMLELWENGYEVLKRHIWAGWR